jgi:hypothetical protein
VTCGHGLRYRARGFFAFQELGLENQPLIPEKQKGGNFLTEILGVLYCEAIASFLFFFVFERFFLSNTKKNT